MKNNTLSSRKHRSIETKKKLLHAGYTIFIRNGFQKTTVTQIIKHAETGYGTAYVYFKNKDDLLIVLMEDVMNQFYDIAERSFSPQTKEEAHKMIQNQVRAFLQLAKKERAILQVVEEAIGLSKEILQKWDEIRERFINNITQDITYSQQSRLAKTELNKDIVARAWFAMNEMFLWTIVKNNNNLELEEIVHTLTEMYTTGLYK
ncbi:MULTISPECIES: TetR/AcrR family transcriptional regulator [Bacillus]|uniref:TetR/AcrR family transcriptional regulator n=2 Tax=Bacillus cereus group TaxID=86661 RepID=A0A2A7DA44_BACAN|nr:MULTISPECIES: TetR/AcrR family transcriptional regulator [Bacillus]MCP1163921.1 TetR/AcrR family transcriptional regulator [Bacillus sp. 1813sda1]MDC7975167.1 TetR/AcrR family transcriptional regulator [Bacillus sp. BLCC-B18]OTW71649.1 TetR family transcriptional regulator [Bacillus thuringiensis serovar coreanensis]OTX55269.1 TetR family transcriptional regulator [Bacillus thuringiensis serovar sooncheon]OTX58606.1 TetR family transcriptional regulator [Bacillus thuringiensis serovar guiya